MRSLAPNTTNAFRYADSTFAATNFTLANGSNIFTAIARDSYGRKDTNSVTVNLPATNIFSYDGNGNLLSDGTRNFAYDDENQLISVWVTNVWRSDFVYDGKMRRRIKRDYTWSSGNWMLAAEIRYIYDGNLVIQERDANNVPLVTYTRGNDLSGTLQGAGGIGGLLALSQPSAPNPQHFYYHADGNGNVTMLLNAYQIPAAKYLYDPYGNILSQSGPLAEANPYRFSSKEWNANAGLYYYGRRFYEPSLQRWLNQDPLGEEGGVNLYSLTGNQPIGKIDYLGLVIVDDVSHTIFVGKNEIGILYGHSYSKKWTWRMDSRNCNAGAAIMCWPVGNSQGIPSDKNLFTSWGGELLVGGEEGMWGMSQTGDDFFTWGGAHLINNMKALAFVTNEARTRAKEILKRCCSKEVHIIYIEIDKNGKQIDPKKQYGDMPAMKDEIITSTETPP